MEPHITQQLRRDGSIDASTGPAPQPAHPGFAPVVPTPRSARNGDRTPRNDCRRETAAAGRLGKASLSDDDLVMICADCGIEIDESHSADSVKCPQTGKLHW